MTKFGQDNGSVYRRRVRRVRQNRECHRYKVRIIEEKGNLTGKRSVVSKFVVV